MQAGASTVTERLNEYQALRDKAQAMATLLGFQQRDLIQGIDRPNAQAPALLSSGNSSHRLLHSSYRRALRHLGIAHVPLADRSQGWEEEVCSMTPVLALTHQTGVRLAEGGFLLIMIAGVWLVAAQIPSLKYAKARTIVAGLLLALGGLLLIIATHGGGFA